MNITFHRIDESMGAQTITINEEKFYCLADIMEQTGAKGKMLHEKNTPKHISGKIVWGQRLVGASLIESVFIDKEGMNRILEDVAQPNNG